MFETPSAKSRPAGGSRLSRAWQVDEDYEAPALAVFGPNPPAMELGDVLDDAQTETGATRFA